MFLLIAGKGHETGQILADRVIPFDEAQIVATLLQERGGTT
jgi:UDP-N-acetylmuramoyl-L-alanyl-D-glutamate--2,6-diaminopimelate ligase